MQLRYIPFNGPAHAGSMGEGGGGAPVCADAYNRRTGRRIGNVVHLVQRAHTQ